MSDDTPFDPEPDDPAADGTIRQERRQERPRKAKAERRPPKPITEDRLQRAALHYLERYATSEENLRRVLRRKVARTAWALGTPPEAHAAEIDAVVARCARVGYVEDARFAEMRARTLRRKGLSHRMILAKLGEKGVAQEVALKALAEVDAENLLDLSPGVSPDPDTQAAMAFARRRRLGPYRRGDRQDREDRRERDMAALARGGFSFEIARKVIDGDVET